jgi:dTDP-4-dehydrorhamnose reductase
MLGSDVCRLLAHTNEHIITALDIQDADIASYSSFKQYVQNKSFGVIIHCAAYTDVDGSETNPELAYTVNGTGTKNIALFAREREAKLMYISTDYVFDGQKTEPYTETDIPNPLNVYASSKLMGEQYVQQLLKRYFIIRTSWLFGRNGKNFVDTIVKKAKTGESLRVVNDQISSPTYTIDLAEAIKDFVQTEKYGIYHISNTGCCSWFEFACEIVNIVGLSEVDKVNPISTEELGRPAKRPKYSKLDSSKYEREIGLPLRSWQQAVKVYLTTDLTD